MKLDPLDPTEVDLQLETGRTKNSERFDRNDNVFIQSKYSSSKNNNLGESMMNNSSKKMARSS